MALVFSSDITGRGDVIIALFRSVFTASAGPDEGDLVAGLAEALIDRTAPEDLHVFLALDACAVIGCIVFSRLRYSEDAREVFLLSPVAVKTDRQGEGIGQALLRHGLHEMAQRGTDIVVTYGDPGYYGKVEFRPARLEDVPPPFPVQQPEGWLVQSLTDDSLRPLRGAPACVSALHDPAFW